MVLEADAAGGECALDCSFRGDVDGSHRGDCNGLGEECIGGMVSGEGFFFFPVDDDVNDNAGFKAGGVFETDADGE